MLCSNQLSYVANLARIISSNRDPVNNVFKKNCQPFKNLAGKLASTDDQPLAKHVVQAQLLVAGKLLQARQRVVEVEIATHAPMTGFFI